MYPIRHIIKSCLLGRQKLKLRISKQHDALFICATGPSAKAFFDNFCSVSLKCDMLLMNDLIVFCKEKVFEIRPSHYILWDPLYFVEDNRFSSQVERGDFLRNSLHEAMEQINWPMTLIIPEWATFRTDNSNISIEYLNTITINKGFFKYHFYNKNYAMPAANNVVQVAAYYGIAKRYKEVFLIGCEYDTWKSTYLEENGEGYICSSHVYKTDELLEKWKLSEDRQSIEHGKSVVGGYLARCAETLDLYCSIAEYARNRNVNIINLSKGTTIDAFPIKKYEDFVESIDGK